MKRFARSFKLNSHRRAFGNVYEVLLSCEGAQMERWLLPTVRGERVCSIAITETGAGSDTGGIRPAPKTTQWYLAIDEQ